jgi:hypothetical protein
MCPDIGSAACSGQRLKIMFSRQRGVRRYTYTHPNADDQQTFVCLEVARLVGWLVDVGSDHAADLHPHIVEAVDLSVKFQT